MKGALGMALAARAHRDGRAVRSALVRHRRLVNNPIALVMWQLGAEPFSAAAIGWGTTSKKIQMCVAGEPRSRDLAFAALLRLARWFNEKFEAPGRKLDVWTTPRSGKKRSRARSAPQVVVANRATVEMIGRLGRRLAYLPLEGVHAAPEELVRLGMHFQFLARHARMPGQQLIVPLDELLQQHWVTPQSAFERASLGALDAFIEPPPRVHGFHAAEQAERISIGPLPGDEDRVVADLMDVFNAARDGSTAPKKVAPLLKPIEQHYLPLLQRTWTLLWRVLERERLHPEAASVGRRWDVDRDEYTWHLNFLKSGFRRRTRQSSKQAAELLRKLETAQKLVEVEEVCDDLLRVVPYVLEHKALLGTVTHVDRTHKEMGEKKPVVRPLITIALDEPCLMPAGKQLWWTDKPSGKGFEVVGVDGASIVLKCNSQTESSAPSLGKRVAFSTLNTESYSGVPLPKKAPWPYEEATSSVPDLEEAAEP